jgi:hypothetical protein
VLGVRLSQVTKNLPGSVLLLVIAEHDRPEIGRAGVGELLKKRILERSQRDVAVSGAMGCGTPELHKRSSWLWLAPHSPDGWSLGKRELLGHLEAESPVVRDVLRLG